MAIEKSIRDSWVVALRSGHYPQGLNELIRMNDEGETFEFIANWIEENVPITHTDKCSDPGCPDHGVMTVNNGD